ncbi:MAG: hypothetical protein PGN08_00130 [Sphingomonas taxi]
MSAVARIDAVRLTPTHDGESALLVTLRFANGGRSNVQIDSASLARVMARAGVASAFDLVGCDWAVLDVDQPRLHGTCGEERKQ